LSAAEQDDARAQACSLLEAAGQPPPSPADALAVAWALKERCYQAWHGEPGAAVRAAEALARLRDSQPGQVELAALADWTAGIASLTRGEMAQAVPLFDAAGAGLRAAGRPDPAAQSQVPRIMALAMLGRHDEAVACGLDTQRELRALGNVAAAARVSQNLGNLYLSRDDYPQAVRHFREAAVLFARQRDHLQSVLADIGVGVALAALGDFDEAGRIYARARMRATHHGLDLKLALVDESVGVLDLARARYPQALAGFESARRRYASMGLPQHVAVAEKQLGDVYLELRLLPEALALFDAAVQKFQALGLAVEEAWALTQRGRAQALMGQAAAAAVAFQRAAALFEQQRNAVGMAAVALARAKLALTSGDTAGALSWAEQARAGYATAGRADGQARAELIEAHARLSLGQVAQAAAAFDGLHARAVAMRQVQIQVRALTGQGLAAQAVGDRAAAARAFESAIESFEDQRRALPSDEMRSAFLADHLRPYQERLRMALQDGAPAEVLLQLDRFRARALDERLLEAGPAAAGDEDQGLRERLNWLYRRAQRLQDESGASAALQDEVLRAERELLERVRRRRVAAPLRPDVAGAAAGLDLAALQALLQPGDRLVEYGVDGDALFACVISSRDVQLVRGFAPWPGVLEACRSTRFQIETLRHGSAHLQAHVATLTRRAQARLRHLHTLVWAPLAPALDGARRVLVVPHGALADVPFSALMDGDTPLGRQVQLALAPSARAALRALRQPPAAPRRVLALGESSRLPHAAHEARFVAGLFSAGRAFTGDEATLKALQQGAPEADVVHLACHAQFRTDNPRFSALHLADAALTAELAEGLGLRNATVVLSACETSLADNAAGDEMVGLVRAFLVSGAARVVASLWPVDDEVTMGFMSTFYAALAAGAEVSAALRAAQEATMVRYPHPCYWGAFTVHGAW